MNRSCITSSQVLSLQVSPKFTFCSPGCPLHANGKLMQQGAHVYLTVTVTVKYNIAATSVSRMATSTSLSRRSSRAEQRAVHSEPCTGVWKHSLDDWTALALSWSKISSIVWKLKVFKLQGYKMSDRCSPLQIHLNFFFFSHIQPV